MYCFDGSWWTIADPTLRVWDYLNIVVTTTTPRLVRVVSGSSSMVVLSGSSLATKHNLSSSRPLLVSPYELKCIAVKHSAEGFGEANYSFHAEYKIDYKMPIVFFAGCFLLLAARDLGRNVLLLYLVGVAIGILGSGLALLYAIKYLVQTVGGCGVGGSGGMVAGT